MQEPKKRVSHIRVKTDSGVLTDDRNEMREMWKKAENKSPMKIKQNFLHNEKQKYLEENNDFQFTEPDTFFDDQGIQEKFEDSSNFSKIKHLYKYPFKDIDEYKYDISEGNLDNNQEFFEKIYRDLCQKHELCGPDCGHLKRFYHRIRFMGPFLRKKELSLQKSIIDKLPLNKFQI